MSAAIEQSQRKQDHPLWWHIVDTINKLSLFFDGHDPQEKNNNRLSIVIVTCLSILDMSFIKFGQNIDVFMFMFLTLNKKTFLMFTYTYEVMWKFAVFYMMENVFLIWICYARDT